MDQKGLGQAMAQAPQEQQKPPVFNIPKVLPQAPPVGEPIQESQPSEEPEKKKGWKKWFMIILTLMIILGLGYYFLFL